MASKHAEPAPVSCELHTGETGLTGCRADVMNATSPALAAAHTKKEAAAPVVTALMSALTNLLKDFFKYANTGALSVWKYAQKSKWPLCRLLKTKISWMRRPVFLDECRTQPDSELQIVYHVHCWVIYIYELSNIYIYTYVYIHICIF